MLGRFYRTAMMILPCLLTGTAGIATAESAQVFGVTGEQCTAPVSIDGDMGAMEDQYTDRLYLYDFQKKQLLGTSVVERDMMPNISGHLVAYQTYQPNDPSLPYWKCAGISIYNVVTGDVTATPITTAERRYYWHLGRYFDGEKIVFTDLVDGHLKIYWLSSGAITDTGIAGEAPTVDGSNIAFEVLDHVGFYDIASGQVDIIGAGSNPTLGGSIISYYATGYARELKYYDISMDAVLSTGLTDVRVQKTDGERIVAQVFGGPIVLVDLKTGGVKETKQHGCGYSESCWIEVSSKYVAYERFEGGTFAKDDETGQWYEVYPPADYNQNGILGECVGFWFKL